MSRHRVSAEYAAALSRVGFQRRLVARDTGAGLDVYRRPAVGHWFLEARQEGGSGGHVDVGLTVDVEGGALIGPVHRALTPAALESALPHIIASLEALARAGDSLRCPTCSSWPVMHHGADGPFLACGQTMMSRKPFDTRIRPCRRHLVMGGVIIHGDPDPPW